MSAKTFAITGATGFVGKALLRHVPENAQLRLLVRDRQKLQAPANATIIEGALSDAQALLDLCQGADVVIHVAGAIKAMDRKGFHDVNEKAVIALAEAARKSGVKRFIYVSSLAAREPSLSDYAASKRAGEHGLAYAARDMEWVIVRPPAIYGPGDEATLPLMRALTSKRAILPGSSEQLISLMHVDDVAQALWLATQETVVAGKVYEVDDGKKAGYSWAELCSLAEAYEGHEVKALFVPRWSLTPIAGLVQLWAEITRQPQILSAGKIAELYHEDWVARGPELAGFSPKIGFAQGFAETVSSYRAAGRLRARREAATTQKQS